MSLTPPIRGDLDSSDIVQPDPKCALDFDFDHAQDNLRNDQTMTVFARVRPLLPHEKAKGYNECIVAIEEKTVRVEAPANSAKQKSSRQSEPVVEDFSFSAAFGPETGQFVFFHHTTLGPMQNFIEGSSSLIFSYGVTGSGKTYTLQGNSDNPGIIPLSLNLYFSSIEKQLMNEVTVKPHQYCDSVPLSEKDRAEELSIKKEILALCDECDNVPGAYRTTGSKSFAMSLCNFLYDIYEDKEPESTLCPEDMASAQTAALMKEVSRRSADAQQGVINVWVSFVEIYNDNVFDLLHPIKMKRESLKLGEDKNGNVYIKDLREICVSSSEEALKLLNFGRKQLKIASTKMNYESSRSHCIYTLRVVRLTDENNPKTGKVNRLSFCDLAGSEKASKAQTTGDRLKEAGNINLSLLTLKRCFEALRMNQTGREKLIVPFRNSKLTRVFSSFFLGNGKAVMIANASPSDYTFDETLRVLEFSAIAQKIVVTDLLKSSATTVQMFEQWQSLKQNNSTSFNESMDSDTSYLDMLKQKDELMETLFDNFTKVLSELTEVKREKAEMEMRIRREVYDDYSKYSDKLIEKIRADHEDEMNTLRKIYDQRLEKSKKRYEAIIKGYQEQLEDSDEVNCSDTSMNTSKEEFNDSQRKSPKHKLDSTILDKDGNSELEALKQQIAALNEELENTKNQFTESQNIIANLEIELSVTKTENKKMGQQIMGYQEKLSGYTLSAKECDSKIQALEKELAAYRVETKKSQNLLQQRTSDISKLENEINFQKNQNDDLLLTLEELKKAKDFGDKTVKEQRLCIRHLEEQLSNEKEEKSAALEKLNLQVTAQKNLESTEQEEMNSYKQQIEALIQEKKNALEKQQDMKTQLLNMEETVALYEKELTAAHQQCENKTDKQKNMESEILSLEEKVSLYQKELAATREECKSKSEIVRNLKLEIEKLTNENESLSKKCEDYEMMIANLNSTCEAIKSEKEALLQKLSSIRDDLSAMNEKVELKTFIVTELETEIETYKSRVEILTKEIDQLKELKISKEAEVEILLENNNVLKEEKKSHTQSIAELEKELDCSRKRNLELKRASKETSNLQLLHVKDIERYKEKVNYLQEEMEKSKTNSESLKTDLLEQLHMCNRKCESLKDQVLEKESIIQQLQAEITGYKREMQELESVYKIHEEKLKSDNQLYKERVESLDCELKICRKEIDNKTLGTSEVENEINSYKMEIKKLQKEKEKYESERSQLMENISKYESSVSELELDLSSATQEANRLKARLKEKRTSICAEQEKQVESSSEDDKSKIKRLEANLNNIYAELEVTKIDLNLQADSIKTLEDQISTDKQKMEKYKQDLRKFSDNKAKLTAELKSREEALRNLEKLLQEANMKANMESEENTKKIYDLEQKLLEASKELSTANNHKKVITELEEKLNEAVIKRNEYLIKISSIEREFEEKLNEATVNATNERNGHLMKISALESDIELYGKEMKNELKAMESKLATEKSMHENRVKDLKKQLETALKDKTKAEEALKVAKQDGLEISEFLKKFEAKVEIDEKEIAKLKENLLTTETEREDLKSQLSLADLELKSVKEEIQKKSKTIQELKDKMNEIVSDINKKLKDSDAEKSELKIEIASYKDKLSNIMNKLGSTERRLTKTSEELTSALNEANKIKELESENDMYKNVIEDYRKKLEAKAETDVTQAEVQKYKEKIASLEENLEQVKEELDFAKEKLQIQLLSCKELETEISNIKEKLLTKEKEIETLLKTVEEAKSEQSVSERALKTLQKEIDSLKKEKSSLEEQHTKVSEQLGALLTENQNLANNLSLSEKSVTNFKKEVEDLNKNVENLLQQIDSMKEQKEGALLQLACNLEVIEIKATNTIIRLRSILNTQIAHNNAIARQVIDKSNNIDDLQIELAEAQNKLSELQRSYDKKILAEKSQHAIELEQALNQKKHIGEENKRLLMEISELKQNQKENKVKQSDPEIKKDLSFVANEEFSLESEDETPKRSSRAKKREGKSVEKENESPVVRRESLRGKKDISTDVKSTKKVSETTKMNENSRETDKESRDLRGSSKGKRDFSEESCKSSKTRVDEKSKKNENSQDNPESSKSRESSQAKKVYTENENSRTKVSETKRVENIRAKDSKNFKSTENSREKRDNTESTLNSKTRESQSTRNRSSQQKNVEENSKIEENFRKKKDASKESQESLNMQEHRSMNIDVKERTELRKSFGSTKGNESVILIEDSPVVRRGSSRFRKEISQVVEESPQITSMSTQTKKEVKSNLVKTKTEVGKNHPLQESSPASPNPKRRSLRGKDGESFPENAMEVAKVFKKTSTQSKKEQTLQSKLSDLATEASKTRNQKPTEPKRIKKTNSSESLLKPKNIKKSESTESLAKHKNMKKSESTESLAKQKNMKKNESTESLAKRPLRVKTKKKLPDFESSFSSISSLEEDLPKRVSKRVSDREVEMVELPTQKNRKRVSDEDFLPHQPSKRQKSLHPESKVTQKRPRRTVQEPEKTLSPVQKFANCISTKFRSMTETAKNYASPRLTRGGKKRLFNPETSSTSSLAQNEKVPRGGRKPATKH